MYITYVVTYKELNTVGKPIKTVKVTAAGNGYNGHAAAFIEAMQEEGREVYILSMLDEKSLGHVTV